MKKDKDLVVLKKEVDDLRKTFENRSGRCKRSRYIETENVLLVREFAKAYTTVIVRMVEMGMAYKSVPAICLKDSTLLDHGVKLEFYGVEVMDAVREMMEGIGMKMTWLPKEKWWKFSALSDENIKNIAKSE